MTCSPEAIKIGAWIIVYAVLGIMVGREIARAFRNIFKDADDAS